MKDLLIGLALLSGPALVFAFFGTSGLDAFDDSTSPAMEFTLSEEGRVAFAEDCVRCHGRLAEGTERAPALVASRYAPDRFSDGDFNRAVRFGIAPSRPGSGGMPSYPGLTDRDLDRMLAFLRGLQREHGIE